MAQLWQVIVQWSVIRLLTCVVAACGVGGLLWRWVTCNRRQNAMLLAMGQYLLIYYGECLLARGSMTMHEWSSFHQLYEAYHGLGGNGVLTTLYERCCVLTIRKEEEDATQQTGTFAK